MLFCICSIAFISSCKPDNTKNTSLVAKEEITLPIQWQVNADGSFDVVSSTIKIQQLYPSIDGKAIHPLDFKVDNTNNKQTINYRLAEGKSIKIILSNDKNSLIINSELLGFDTAPIYFCPAGSGVMVGTQKIFKQGLGFAGPSSIMDMPSTNARVDINGLHEHTWSYDSYLVSGLIDSTDAAIAIGSYKHHNYLQRTTFYNKQHRFGLLDRWEAFNENYIDIGFSTEKIPVSNKSLSLPELHLIFGNKSFNTFQKFASNVALDNNINLTQPPAYHWCSWYESQKDFNEKILNDVLNGLDKIQPKIPIQTIQIDDGYFSYYGDWLHFDTVKFPSGFQNNINKIKEKGYRAGVWIGPFMVHEKSDLFKNHPDWILHHLDGSKVVEWESAEGNTYILDASNPKALAYLRQVFKTFKSMGISYFKTDFMDWGLRNSVQYKRHTPGKTSAQYFDDVLKMIREEIGNESFWLGCIMPFPGAIGYVDAIRNSNDVGTSWSEGSQGNMIQESITTQYMNNILWQIDPDVLYLNSFTTTLSDDQCVTLALFDGMLGGVINTSDRFHNMTKEHLKLWRFIQPDKEHSSAYMPFWNKNEDVKIMVRNYQNNDGAILFTNSSAKKISHQYALKSMLNQQPLHIYVWEPGKSNYLGLLEKVSINLEPHQSKLIYFNTNQVAPNAKLGLYGIEIEGLE